MGNNYGILECKGRAASYSGLNKILKHSNVEFAAARNNLGAGLSSIIIKGNNAEIDYALNIGREEAEKTNQVLGAISINNLSKELENLILNKKSEISKKNNNLINSPVALIEVFTFSAAMKIADQVLKSTNVKLLAVEKSKGGTGTPGLILCLKFTGSNDALIAAKKIALNTAKAFCEIPASTILSNPKLTTAYLTKEGI
jgi:microcompartment protein CcmL/EutN